MTPMFIIKPQVEAKIRVQGVKDSRIRAGCTNIMKNLFSGRSLIDRISGIKERNSEAPRPPRRDGADTAGLPGKEISFILCPFTPPTGRGLRGTFRSNTLLLDPLAP
jgi:hypothetical protein